MFGYVTGNGGELTQEQKDRYQSVYCGICREIRDRASQACRLGLSYDMAFLALILMSLYEPEDTGGDRACLLHPIKPRPWVDNEFIRYSADMNVALAYYNFRDDWQDDRKVSAKLLSELLGRSMPEIRQRWPRQCSAIADSLRTLGELEAEGCGNPDLPANAFGSLMAELFAYREDFWAPTLRELGRSLGRFIYLLDAVMDYDEDVKKGDYNPLIAMGTPRDPGRFEEYLVLAMGRCAAFYEHLPLVQDKALLDNILYSGVWVAYRGKEKKEDHHDR